MALTHQEVLDKITAKFGGDILSSEVQYDTLIITFNKDINLSLMQYLYDDKYLEFQFLTDLTGIHYPDQLLSLGVVYHLHSFKHNYRLRLKCFMTVEQPIVKSLTPLYAAANWMERETYDFFGIIFEGHPNLKRILNVDSMDVFPMRKEFPLEDPNRVDKKDSFFGR
jgi:NADH-quinone oxidoreductase subunit C